MIDFKKDLNDAQYLAATSNSQYLKIVAGAGTGKTRTLTYRLANMIMRGDIFATQIVAITFTNKVAKEMRTRVGAILKDHKLDDMGSPIIMTFHGFCYRFLRDELCKHYNTFKEPFTIADSNDQTHIWKRIAENAGWKAKDKTFQGLVKVVRNMKSSGIRVDEAKEDTFTEKKTKELYAEYQKELAKSNALDFDDLLLFTYEILNRDEDCKLKYQSKYKAFLIDEFQDTNSLQYRIVKLFMAPKTELCVVGDPDQTIYTWRGADNNIIKTRLNKDFPSLQTIVLDLNYRSTQAILDKANALIKNNKDRVDKSLTAFSKEKGKDVEFFSFVSQDSEAKNLAMKIKNFHTNDGAAYSDMAIIYRSNFLSRVFEKNFNLFRIPYELYGGIKFYERAEVKAGLAYLRLLNNPDDILSFENVIQNPSIKIGKVTLANLTEQAAETEQTIFSFIKDHMDTIKVSANQKENLMKIVDAHKVAGDQLSKENDDIGAIITTLKEYFGSTGFMTYVRQWDKKEEEDKGDNSKENTREDNINELFTAINDYFQNAFENPEEGSEPNLNDFLINVALESDQDTIKDEDKVAVMTGHVSKGLEFKYVFVTGLVDGILPSGHASEDGNKGMEEERRLFYVAMTRAKRYLCISTFGGFRFGSMPNYPSHFLKEIGFKAERDDSRLLNPEGYKNIYPNPHSTYGAGYASNPYERRKRKTGAGISAEYVPQELSGIKRTGMVRSSGPSAITYNVGDKVAHSSYGVGTINKVSGKKLYVDFKKDVGQKVLIAGFKAFKKI